MAPFGDFKDFEDCVSKNSDKEDPSAYCAVIKRSIEGENLKVSEKLMMLKESLR